MTACRSFSRRPIAAVGPVRNPTRVVQRWVPMGTEEFLIRFSK
jgi:hypothetical protein